MMETFSLKMNLTDDEIDLLKQQEYPILLSDARNYEDVHYGGLCSASVYEIIITGHNAELSCTIFTPNAIKEYIDCGVDYCLKIITDNGKFQYIRFDKAEDKFVMTHALMKIEEEHKRILRNIDKIPRDKEHLLMQVVSLMEQVK